MADILISMNKTTDKLWKYADEWEKTPEHFDGVNPFCVAIHAVRQITNAPELPKEQKHGHWKEVREYYDDEQHWQCSVCGCEWYLEVGNPDENDMLYCPECGAKMDEVKQDD